MTRWLILFGLWLSYFSFGLVMTSLSPLVNRIESDLDFSHAAMGSIMGAWQLVYIFSAIPCGLLIDRLGGRRALAIGLLLVGISAFGRAFAVDYWSLLIVVMLFGLGGPMISSGAPKIVAGLFTGSQRGLAMGIYITGPAVGGIVCLILTHPLMALLDISWRGVLLIWSVIVFTGLAVWWVTSITLVHKTSQQAIANNLTSEIKNIRFLLSRPALRIVLLMSIGVFMLTHGLSNWLPELLRHSGMSELRAGYWAAIPTTIGILASLTIPRLATPDRRFFILSSLFSIAAVACILLSIADGYVLIVALILQGVSLACMLTILMLVLVELPEIGEKHIGTAGGMFFSAAEIGGLGGPLSLGILYGAFGDFTMALIMLTMVCILLLIASRLLKSHSEHGND